MQPFLALITPLTGGEGRPDNSLPGVPVYPGNALPGVPARPDNSLPGVPAYPGNALPPVPGHPGNALPTPPGHVGGGPMPGGGASTLPAPIGPDGVTPMPLPVFPPFNPNVPVTLPGEPSGGGAGWIVVWHPGTGWFWVKIGEDNRPTTLPGETPKPSPKS